MNAPHPIILPENIRISVENQISTEDGSIDFRCFDGAVTHVRRVLEESFVPKFHKSSYCAAYQLDVLRKDVCLADIILCQDSITHFMEFLEQKGHENHALFWVSVEAFQEHLRRSGAGGGCKMEDVGDDAIALYDTYLSLQVIFNATLSYVIFCTNPNFSRLYFCFIQKNSASASHLLYGCF